MNHPDSHDQPLLDDSVLERLRAESDDDAGTWKVFVQNFIEQMPLRTGNLRSTLTSGDVKGALAAILSLRTSAQMVGAVRNTFAGSRMRASGPQTSWRRSSNNV